MLNSCFPYRMNELPHGGFSRESVVKIPSLDKDVIWIVTILHSSESFTTIHVLSHMYIALINIALLLFMFDDIYDHPVASIFSIICKLA